MKGLGDVRRGIVQHHRFAVTDIGCAVAVAPLLHLWQNPLGKLLPVKEEVQIAAHRFHPGNAGTRPVKPGGKRIGDLHRCTPQHLAQLEARQGKVAHFFVRRIFQKRRNRIGIHSGAGRSLCNHTGNHTGDLFFDFQHR